MRLGLLLAADLGQDDLEDRVEVTAPALAIGQAFAADDEAGGAGSGRLKKCSSKNVNSPVAMITDCPAIKRGVDATVPIVPGLVSEIVVP